MDITQQDEKKVVSNGKEGQEKVEVESRATRYLKEVDPRTTNATLLGLRRGASHANLRVTYLYRNYVNYRFSAHSVMAGWVLAMFLGTELLDLRGTSPRPWHESNLQVPHK